MTDDDPLAAALRRDLQTSYVSFDPARADEMIRLATAADLLSARRYWAAPAAAAAAVVLVGGGGAYLTTHGSSSPDRHDPGRPGCPTTPADPSSVAPSPTEPSSTGSSSVDPSPTAPSSVLASPVDPPTGETPTIPLSGVHTIPPPPGSTVRVVIRGVPGSRVVIAVSGVPGASADSSLPAPPPGNAGCRPIRPSTVAPSPTLPPTAARPSATDGGAVRTSLPPPPATSSSPRTPACPTRTPTSIRSTRGSTVPPVNPSCGADQSP